MKRFTVSTTSFAMALPHRLVGKLLKDLVQQGEETHDSIRCLQNFAVLEPGMCVVQDGSDLNRTLVSRRDEISIQVYLTGKRASGIVVE